MSIKKEFKFIIVILAVLFMALFIVYSEICKIGVERGLMICSNVVVPSLFPFLVCVIMIINLNYNFNNKKMFKFVFCLFGQNCELFIVMLLSMIGGYPIGSKLINEMYKQNKITKNTANLMQMYCVNAGPAFVISAVGSGILNSKKIGIILFVSHIFSSIFLALIVSNKMKKSEIKYKNTNLNSVNISDVFIKSVSDAAQNVITICSYVVLFSAINSYLIYFFDDIPIFKYLCYFTEVTTSITSVKNIYTISFLLGFSGISIWLQIISLSKDVKIDLKLFILGRILHGSISALITFILIKILKISNDAYCNNTFSKKSIVYDDISVSISLAVMIIVLLIFIYSKNNSRKIIDDMI